MPTPREEFLNKEITPLRPLNPFMGRMFENETQNEPSNEELKGKIEALESKVDELTQKLDLIFGKQVLVNGKWINVSEIIGE